MLKNISRERILLELNKMIMSETSDNVFKQMFDAKILEEIIPGAVFDLSLLAAMPLDTALRYASLLHKTDIDIAQKILRDMKFSNSNTKQIMDLIAFKQKNKDSSLLNLKEIKNIFYPLWVDNIQLEPYLAISMMKENKNYEALVQITENPPPIFPVNGDDILSLGITGKDIGITLERIKSKWIESEFSLSKKELL
jgi:tRNA nucleotidyltransferase/poly(A) polymerase